ncbi:MAG: hypothetical protein J7J25_01885 [Candidatus Omnitrophica bacterium]|nr:hypothetical protein [Candidatus Omnitrophota bacterium]
MKSKYLSCNMDKLLILSLIFSLPFSLVYSQNEPEADSEETAAVSSHSFMQIKPLEKNKYTIELRDVDIRDLLRMLSHDYKLNILIGEGIRGKITASFNNITISGALEAIAKASNLLLKREGGIIKVVPHLVTRIFVLQHVEAKKLLEESQKKEESMLSSSGSSASSSNSGSNTQSTSSQSSQTASTTSSSTVSGSSSDEIKTQDTIFDLLSEEGKILLGQEPNSLMVIDYPENVERIEAFLNMIDKRMSMEVFRLKYLSAAEIVGEIEKKTRGVSTTTSSSTSSTSTSSESSDEDGNYPVTSKVLELLSLEGKILFGQEPNSLMVIDYPENLNRISEYIKIVDTCPRQVLIEARIVEVKLQGENALGVNWSLFAEKEGFKMGQFRIGSIYPGSPGALTQAIDFKNTYYPPGQTSTTNKEEPFTVSIFDENINLVLKALANNLNTNILSAPRVTTVNNRPAEIKVTERLPWAEPEVDVLDNGGVSVTWDINFEEVGIKLKVTPIITEDNHIIMTLNPEVSEKVDDYELNVVQGTTSIPYTVPVIDTRSAKTKVVVGNGQTLIIGGLIRENNTAGETKVPLLGNIPIVGHLFKSTRKTKDKTELLIFVSPTIINKNSFVRMAKLKEYSEKGKPALEQEKKERDKQEKAMELVMDKIDKLESLKEMHNKIKAEQEVLQQRLLEEEMKLQTLNNEARVIRYYHK